MKNIGIIGSKANTRYLAPYGAKDWEFWSLNNLFLVLDTQHFHKWFELHDFQYKNKTYYRRNSTEYKNESIKYYMMKIADLNIPVYMQQKWDIIPKSRVFPFNEIIEHFKTNYFGCSFTWMIAYILYQHMKGDKVKKIGIWGTDLDGIEYYHQLPSFVYFLGIARGLGIELVIPEESKLLKIPFVYALAENSQHINDLFVGLSADFGIKATLFFQQMLDDIRYGN